MGRPIRTLLDTARDRYGEPRRIPGEDVVVELVEQVEAVGRLASARAAETESLRRLPDDVAAAIVGTGLLRAWVPARYGGAEAGALEVLDAIEALAFHDGAAGWCAMIGATTALTSAHLPPEWAERIYGDPAAVTGGFAMPVGTGCRVEGGGLVVNGRWAWGSGTHHCTWIGGGVLVEGEGAPFVFFERDQVEILDTWHVAGLRGTGSNDYRVVDALVPEGRWVHIGAEPVVDGAVYRLPFLGMLALGVCSVALGLARRAQAELVALAADKRPMGSGRTLAERPVVQVEVARAEAAWRSARAFIREVVEEASSHADVRDDDRRNLRLAATNATWSAADAVDRMYHAGGGAAIHEASPLQRVFRDVHVATQHAMVAERTLEPIGRMALGLPTDVRGL